MRNRTYFLLITEKVPNEDLTVDLFRNIEKYSDIPHPDLVEIRLATHPDFKEISSDYRARYQKFIHEIK